MDIFSFRLTDKFIEPYKTKPVNWGYTDAAGNSVGELTFIRTYSRRKEDGTKEKWFEVCERVINGMFSIQKDHCKANRLPWNDNKAHKLAQEAYDRLFSFKWSPPGRGLWMMGTPLVMVERNSAALQNCAFVSSADMTKLDPSYPFAFLMEASMLGVGVGGDNKGASKDFEVTRPAEQVVTYAIPDSREGWVESVKMLLESYLISGRCTMQFVYDHIRPAGTPIKTFGGTAAGPEPLKSLHEQLRTLLDARVGSNLTKKDIIDINNLIGVCVVAGNVRRSAELMIGAIDDDEFINLKNVQRFPERAAWGWMSNNSVEAKVGDNYSHLVPRIASNGEPGVIWMDITRNFGRLVDAPDGKDHRVAGFNPCAEQPLESGEMCTLSEVYISHHDSLEDFKRSVKFSLLYAKTVTLLPTHWARTNAIMQRNRRVGVSITGVTDFADTHGLPKLRQWQEEGYACVRSYDKSYSEWLGVRESIRATTVKPSGTVSIIAGVSPGVHWAPGGRYFMRSIRIDTHNPIVAKLRKAGYKIEVAKDSPDTTVVVYFPVKSDAKRSEKDVSIFEKINIAAMAQRYWSDNGVSATISFDPATEAEHIGTVINMYEGQLKAISFLPMLDEGAYEQMPYGRLSEDEYAKAAKKLKKIDMSDLYTSGEEAQGEKYCTTDVCQLPQRAKE